MEEDFIKEIKIQEKTEKDKEEELIRNIIRVKDELVIASKNFNFVEDEMVDYYTYQMKANQSKLNYLLREAKRKGINTDMINQIKIKLYSQEQDAV